MWTFLQFEMYLDNRINKNDNIYKNEVQDIRRSDEYFKYRLVANITEYHIISELILKRIIITNFCVPVSHLR